MLSEKEIRKLEEARSNILRGNDIESATLKIKIFWIMLEKM